jgi:hypothetical protein
MGIYVLGCGVNNAFLLVKFAVCAWDAVARGIAAHLSVSTPGTGDSRSFSRGLVELLNLWALVSGTLLETK